MGVHQHNWGGLGYLASNIATQLTAASSPTRPEIAGIGAVANDTSSATATASDATSLSAAIAALPNDKVMITDPPSRASGGGGPITQLAQDKYNDLAGSCAGAANIPILDTYAATSASWTQWYA